MVFVRLIPGVVFGARVGSVMGAEKKKEVYNKQM